MIQYFWGKDLPKVFREDFREHDDIDDYSDTEEDNKQAKAREKEEQALHESVKVPKLYIYDQSNQIFFSNTN